MNNKIDTTVLMSMFYINEYLQNLISDKSSKLLQYLFIIWLLLTVIGPHQDIYKVFFHIVVVPITLFYVFTKKVTSQIWLASK